MSTAPLTPFDSILAQLTQGMSAARSSPIVNIVGWQLDSMATVDHLQWIPGNISVEQQHFQIPGATTPWRQAVPFDVHVQGSSLDRVLGLHSLLVAWLDIIVGPPQGGPPSGDETPAALTGVIDLAGLTYPYSGLAGLSIKVTSPGARSLAFPLTPLANPQAIATAINLAAMATHGPTSMIRARIVKEDAARYLELLMPTDPLGTVGSTLTIDPAAANSACAELGFSADDDNITDTGTPAARPYAPGYAVGPTSAPGIRGGEASAQTWGLVVPVTLYLPIVSMAFPQGVIASTELVVEASGGDEQTETVIDVIASAA